MATADRGVRALWQSRLTRDFEREARRGGRVVAISRAAVMIDRDIPAGDVIVDLGCGAGLLATKLPRHRVVGVDFSSRLLAAAAHRAPSVAMASAFALPFSDGSVAAVACLFVMDDYQTAGKQRIADELLRVSAAGGSVILGAYAPTDERMGSRRPDFSDRIDSHPVFLERADFYTDLLVEAGAHSAHSEEIAATGVFTLGNEDHIVQRRFLMVTGRTR